MVEALRVQVEEGFRDFLDERKRVRLQDVSEVGLQLEERFCLQALDEDGALVGV